MKKLFAINVILALFLLVSLIFVTAQYSQAQTSFASIVPYSPGNGTVGFFDQSNGKLYVYSSDLSKLIREVQLEELGQVVEKEKTNGRETFGVLYKD